MLHLTFAHSQDNILHTPLQTVQLFNLKIWFSAHILNIF